ncbi:hypothetical protein HZA96_02800 [Candidatus Woesearchaeota archaeon]|nr:hypothetical protein [Candidatus Woesearchaeota archaeon]
MHFYEASIITTKDGLHCQVYGNEHPVNSILVKPKYIPTDKIECDVLQYRFLSGKRMNRLNLWADAKKLKEYIEQFKKAYPHYILQSDIHGEERLLFSVPIDSIERVYFPKRGFSELMKISKEHLDAHLYLIHELAHFLLGSGLTIDQIGITYSTLVGHYLSDKSDINIVIYGKKNFWKLMEYLKTAKHPLLRWKTREEWQQFWQRRNRHHVFLETEFVELMLNKKSEGFFDNSLFVIFCAEEKDETWFKWGKETYKQLGCVKIQAVIEDSFSSIARPGMYAVKNAKIISPLPLSARNVCNEKEIKQVVFYSRDYCMLANKGEMIEVSGVLEEVSSKEKGRFYRVTIGYFDAYLDGRITDEYIKPISSRKFCNAKFSLLDNSGNQKIIELTDLNEPNNKFSTAVCEFCKEQKQNVGDTTEYGAKIICKVENSKTANDKSISNAAWFATLSPKTAGDPLCDFSVQLIPAKHLRYFSEINSSKELAQNYGIIFGKISYAISKIIKEESNNNNIIPIAAYGKCKHPDEHIHIKLFPYRNAVAQPFTVDSSYEKKEVFKDKEIGEEFIKMKPVKKKQISENRLQELSQKLITLCNGDTHEKN